MKDVLSNELFEEITTLGVTITKKYHSSNYLDTLFVYAVSRKVIIFQIKIDYKLEIHHEPEQVTSNFALTLMEIN